jgi:hypothetical protein
MVLESVQMILDVLTFPAAMVAAFLPYRHWSKLPGSFPMETAAVAAGVAMLFAGAAVGIPGFLEHATANTSLAIDSQLTEVFRNQSAGYSQGLSQGFAGLSIFTFLLLTPKGWLTTYLIATGGVRMGAAWFGDPVGDPVLTGLDEILWSRRARKKAREAVKTREELEGPEIPDRVVSSAKAGIPGCDFVIVSSRAKPGWARDVVVYTPEACYRIGDPVERTVQGKLRTLYPLTEHVDLEAVRKSVHYDMPDAHSRD